MTKLTILTAPNQTLRIKSKAIRKFGDEMFSLINQMQRVLKASRVPGVGLSAVQIGMPLKIFIAYLSPKISVFINPKIIWHSKELNTDVLPKEKLYLEGCLSVPKVYTLIKRPWAIKVKYQTINQQSAISNQQSEFEGFNATIIQHEIDHLNGILFTDRALEQGAQIYEVGEDEELHPIVL